MADPFLEAVKDDLPALDDLSPHQRRCAAAVALVRAGATYKDAAAQAGVGVATVWRHANGMNSETEYKGGFDRLTTDVESLAMAITIRASEKILERLQSKGIDEMRPAEEIKALQVARDTLAMRLGWDSRAQLTDAKGTNALVGALEALRGSKVTIEPADQAIDVTPIGASEGGTDAEG